MHMRVIYVGARNVTGDEKIFGPDPAQDRTRDHPHKILPRRYKSRLVPQGSTSVLYTYTL